MQLLALALALAQAASSPAAPPPATAAAPKGPFVTLEMTQGRQPLGTITIALDPEKAPISVDNFLKYVKAGHYDGTVFHRVMPGFMIQGGGYTPEMEEKPTRPAIVNEGKNGLRNSRGAVAMARLTEPNSASSQFFVNLRDNHRLDFGISGAGYAVFGQVVEGMEVVDRIAMVSRTSRGPHENVPEVPVIIRRAREIATWAPKPAAPAPDPAPKP